jgi:hypothetical protein
MYFPPSNKFHKLQGFQPNRYAIRVSEQWRISFEWQDEHAYNQLVNEKRGVAADMALRLGQLTKTTPQLWLNLQMMYDLWEASETPYKKPFNQIEALASI